MRIFCMGFNLYGQLNDKKPCLEGFHIWYDSSIENIYLGHTFSVAKAKNILKIYCNLSENPHFEFSVNVKQIAINEKNILVLLTNGQLVKISVAEWTTKLLPKFTEEKDEPKLISCNCKLNLVLTTKGLLYSVPEQVADFINSNVIDIKTGKEHALLLDTSGNVYTMGCGSKGQLGTGQLDDHTTPELLQALAGIKIVKIAAGGWHSACVSEQGDLYLWGWNDKGQLGQNDWTVLATPKAVDIGENTEVNVKKVACGTKHTMVLLENGLLYGCGWNKYKQVNNTDQEEYHYFIKIEDFPYKEYFVDKIVCGPWNTGVVGKVRNKTK
ncbi:hypothetical protein ABEB36_011663 [Hypothenemus hampei]|uniref:RCC1 domain-containing protein 1 n=1 Tax=Hypothenemus hampei TaxID=57062 RepID=A0ABD1E8L1_HYPHA